MPVTVTVTKIIVCDIHKALVWAYKTAMSEKQASRVTAMSRAAQSL